MHLMCSLREMSIDCHAKNGMMTAQIAILYLFANWLTNLYPKKHCLREMGSQQTEKWNAAVSIHLNKMSKGVSEEVLAMKPLINGFCWLWEGVIYLTDCLLLDHFIIITTSSYAETPLTWYRVFGSKQNISSPPHRQLKGKHQGKSHCAKHQLSSHSQVHVPIGVLQAVLLLNATLKALNQTECGWLTDGVNVGSLNHMTNFVFTLTSYFFRSIG